MYFNKMWEWRYDEATGGTERHSKHVFLGETRVTTKVLSDLDRVSEESANQYFYHSDHLGSAQLVTDNKGNEYQRIEYTPYGETWIERKTATDNIALPYKFTAKERDEETGLYYYGARYLDPRTSRWLSADPALGDYIPSAPINEEARKANGNLPGLGGVYNLVNMHLYHYAGNNPVKYTDPDGKFTFQLGVTALSGGGSAGVASFGFAIAYNKKNPFKIEIGIYTTQGLGSHFGANAGGSIDIMTSNNPTLEGIAGNSVVTGFSANTPTVAYLGLSANLIVSLDGAEPANSASIGAGVGTPYEGHIYYTNTQISPKEINLQPLVEKVKNYGNKIKDFFVDLFAPESTNP